MKEKAELEAEKIRASEEVAHREAELKNAQELVEQQRIMAEQQKATFLTELQEEKRKILEAEKQLLEHKKLQEEAQAAYLKSCQDAAEQQQANFVAQLAAYQIGDTTPEDAAHLRVLEQQQQMAKENVAIATEVVQQQAVMQKDAEYAHAEQCLKEHSVGQQIASLSTVQSVEERDQAHAKVEIAGGSQEDVPKAAEVPVAEQATAKQPATGQRRTRMPKGVGGATTPSVSVERTKTALPDAEVHPLSEKKLKGQVGQKHVV